MNTVSISSKFQIVIPKELREKLDLEAGTKIQIIPYENRIELIPLTKMKNLRGALKGIDTTIIREKDENIALRFIAHMHLGQVIELNPEIALSAAKLSSTFKVPMADSIILATAQKYNATIWTQDADFSGFEKVKYFEKT